jgi:hypothetical protein
LALLAQVVALLLNLGSSAVGRRAERFADDNWPE